MTQQLGLTFAESSDKTRVLNTLCRFAGRENGVHVSQLAFLVKLSERQVRKLVSELREEGTAICATPRPAISSLPPHRSWRSAASSFVSARCTPC